MHNIFFVWPYFNPTNKTLKYFVLNHVNKESWLGQVNLISRLSSRVTKKYRVDGKILFYNSYFTRKTINGCFVFINTWGIIQCSNYLTFTYEFQVKTLNSNSQRYVSFYKTSRIEIIKTILLSSFHVFLTSVTRNKI
jgi:hypothetical protein